MCCPPTPSRTSPREPGACLSAPTHLDEQRQRLLPALLAWIGYFDQYDVEPLIVCLTIGGIEKTAEQTRQQLLSRVHTLQLRRAVTMAADPILALAAHAHTCFGVDKDNLFTVGMLGVLEPRRRPRLSDTDVASCRPELPACKTLHPLA